MSVVRGRSRKVERSGEEGGGNGGDWVRSVASCPFPRAAVKYFVQSCLPRSWAGFGACRQRGRSWRPLESAKWPLASGQEAACATRPSSWPIILSCGASHDRLPDRREFAGCRVFPVHLASSPWPGAGPDGKRQRNPPTPPRARCLPPAHSGEKTLTDTNAWWAYLLRITVVSSRQQDSSPVSGPF